MNDGLTPTIKPAEGQNLRPSIDGLIDIASQLIALLGRETELLREMKPGQVAPLQDEKLKLTRAYEARVRALNEQGNDLALVDQAIRDELRATMSRFENTAKSNAIAIHAAQVANQRLMQAIVDVLNERRGRTEGYSAAGVTTHTDARPHEGVALTLDQRL